MKPGDKVKVYGDPVTRCELEGTAILVKEISPGYWKVRFPSDPCGYTVNRFIYEQGKPSHA